MSSTNSQMFSLSRDERNDIYRLFATGSCMSLCLKHIHFILGQKIVTNDFGLDHHGVVQILQFYCNLSHEDRVFLVEVIDAVIASTKKEFKKSSTLLGLQSSYKSMKKLKVFLLDYRSKWTFVNTTLANNPTIAEKLYIYRLFSGNTLIGRLMKKVKLPLEKKLSPYDDDYVTVYYVMEYIKTASIEDTISKINAVIATRSSDARWSQEIEATKCMISCIIDAEQRRFKQMFGDGERLYLILDGVEFILGEKIPRNKGFIKDAVLAIDMMKYYRNLSTDDQDFFVKAMETVIETSRKSYMKLPHLEGVLASIESGKIFLDYLKHPCGDNHC